MLGESKIAPLLKIFSTPHLPTLTTITPNPTPTPLHSFLSPVLQDSRPQAWWKARALG